MREADSEPEGCTIARACPACAYDLRVQFDLCRRQGDARVQCPECGGVWPVGSFRGRQLRAERCEPWLVGLAVLVDMAACLRPRLDRRYWRFESTTSRARAWAVLVFSAAWIGLFAALYCAAPIVVACGTRVDWMCFARESPLDRWLWLAVGRTLLDVKYAVPLATVALAAGGGTICMAVMAQCALGRRVSGGWQWIHSVRFAIACVAPVAALLCGMWVAAMGLMQGEHRAGWMFFGFVGMLPLGGAGVAMAALMIVRALQIGRLLRTPRATVCCGGAALATVAIVSGGILVCGLTGAGKWLSVRELLDLIETTW